MPALGFGAVAGGSVSADSSSAPVGVLVNSYSEEAVIYEFSYTTGTGDYALAGGWSTHLPLSARYPGGATGITYYVKDGSTGAGSQFEVGIGDYDAGGKTLSRLSILASSNNNQLVDWSGRTRLLVRPLVQAIPLCPTPPTIGQVLTWNGTEWCPATPATPSGGGSNCWTVRSKTFLAYTMNSLMGYIISGGTGYRASDLVNNFGDLVFPVGGMIGTNVPSPYGRSAMLSVLGASGGAVTDLSSSDAADVAAGGWYIYPPANPVSQLSSTGPGTGLLFDIRTDGNGWERVAWSNVLMSSDGRFIYGSGGLAIIDPVTGQRNSVIPIIRSVDGGLTWTLDTPFKFLTPDLSVDAMDCASDDLSIIIGRGAGFMDSMGNSAGSALLYSEDSGRAFTLLPVLDDPDLDPSFGNVACSSDGRFVMFSAINDSGTVIYTGTVTEDGTVRSVTVDEPGKGYLVGDQVTMVALAATTPVTVTISGVTVADVRNVSVVSGGSGNSPGLPQFKTSDGTGQKPILFGSVNNSGVVTSIPLIATPGMLKSNLSSPEPMLSIGGGSGVEFAFSLSAAEVTIDSGAFTAPDFSANPFYQASTTGAGIGASFNLGFAQVTSWDHALVDTSGGGDFGFVTLVVAMSSNGTVRVAADNQQTPLDLPGSYLGLFYFNGSSWASATLVGGVAGDQVDWLSIACSSDGSLVVAVPAGGYLLASSDGGASYSSVVSAGDNGWRGPVAISADGSVIAARTNDAVIFSLDRGSTWTAIPGSDPYGWDSLALSADGKRLATATARIHGFAEEASLTVLELPCSASDPA